MTIEPHDRAACSRCIAYGPPGRFALAAAKLIRWAVRA